MNSLKDTMTRLCSQDAAAMVGGKYDLVLIAAQRVRELRRGSPSEIAGSGRNPITTALREIEDGKVGREYLLKIRR